MFLIAFDLNYAVTEQDGFNEEHSTSLNALYYEEHINFILRIYSKHGKGMANNMLLQPQLDSRVVQELIGNSRSHRITTFELISLEYNCARYSPGDLLTRTLYKDIVHL